MEKKLKEINSIRSLASNSGWILNFSPRKNRKKNSAEKSNHKCQQWLCTFYDVKWLFYSHVLWLLFQTSSDLHKFRLHAILKISAFGDECCHKACSTSYQSIISRGKRMLIHIKSDKMAQAWIHKRHPQMNMMMQFEISIIRNGELCNISYGSSWTWFHLMYQWLRYQNKVIYKSKIWSQILTDWEHAVFIRWNSSWHVKTALRIFNNFSLLKYLSLNE